MPNPHRDALLRLFEVRIDQETRFLALEGLRGLAVICVFFVHFCSLAAPWSDGTRLNAFADALHLLGNIGVDMFFTLSGYLIYGTLLKRRQHFGDFLARRAQRLYPVFAVMLLVYLGLSLLVPAESKLPSGGLSQLIYIVENALLLPGIFPIRPIIEVSWSLSYEVFFYLSVPLLMAVLRLRAWPVAARLALFLAVIAAIPTLGLPHPRMGMFVAGMVLVELGPMLRARPLRSGLIDGAVLATAVLYGAALLSGISEVATYAATAACAFAFCLAALLAHDRVGRMLTWSPIRWLGNMSYSYYLAHGLVLKAMFFALARVLPGHTYGVAAWFVLLPLGFVATWIGSAALYLAVERPYSIFPRRPAGQAAPLSENATVTDRGAPRSLEHHSIT